MAADEPSSVQYTVKELIGRLDAKMDLLLDAVASKASVAALDRMDGRLSEAIDRITAVEAEQATAKAVGVNTRWLLFSAVPTTVALAVTLSKIL